MYMIYILEYLLPWKIIADQDAEGHLRLSLPKDLEENRPENHNHDEKWDKSNESETNDSTRKILYEEKEPKKEPDRTEAKTETTADGEETEQGLEDKTNKLAIANRMEIGHIPIEKGKVELRQPKSAETGEASTKKTKLHEEQKKPYIFMRLDTRIQRATKRGSSKYGSGPDKPRTGDARSNSERNPRNSQYRTHSPREKFTSNKSNNTKSEHKAPNDQTGHNDDCENKLHHERKSEWEEMEDIWIGKEIFPERNIGMGHTKKMGRSQNAMGEDHEEKYNNDKENNTQSTLNEVINNERQIKNIEDLSERRSEDPEQNRVA